jgi:hypothetical protein
LKCR